MTLVRLEKPRRGQRPLVVINLPGLQRAYIYDDTKPVGHEPDAREDAADAAQEAP